MGSWLGVVGSPSPRAASLPLVMMLLYSMPRKGPRVHSDKRAEQERAGRPQDAMAIAFRKWLADKIEQRRHKWSLGPSKAFLFSVHGGVPDLPYLHVSWRDF